MSERVAEQLGVELLGVGLDGRVHDKHHLDELCCEVRVGDVVCRAQEHEQYCENVLN